MIGTSPDFSFYEAKKKLEGIGQQHLLKFWSKLTLAGQYELLHQIHILDVTDFLHRKQLFLSRSQKEVQSFSPFQDFQLAGSKEDAALGQQLIADGKVGCLILAGGQGSRLRFHGPKGLYPVTPFKHKSLFQLFAERTFAASQLALRPLKMAVMTSLQNHDQTVAFFDQNQRFGLEREQLSFFLQGHLPLLDEDGNLFLDSPSTISAGPDGNGSCLSQFVRSGIWDEWNKAGIQYLNLILIDNALSDPFSNELIGFHSRTGPQITVKCFPREDAKEKVGVLVKGPHGIHIVEYSEMPPEERSAVLANGLLKHRCANMSSFCFDMEFIRDFTAEHKLPWHLAHKSVPQLNEEGMCVVPFKPNAWKYEQFIFDWLPLAKSIQALMFPREDCFAPLKNENGDSSLHTVQQALIRRDIAVMEKLTGRKIMAKNIELAQEFYYPTQDLIQRWHNRTIENEGYIADNLEQI